MTNEATLKTGDTGRVLELTLTYGDGTAIDLTGCTIEFRWRPLAGTYSTLTLTSAAGDVVVHGAATDGVIRVSGFEAGDVDEAGTYVAEVVITDSSDQEITVPSDGYLPLRIVPGIEPAPGP